MKVIKERILTLTATDEDWEQIQDLVQNCGESFESGFKQVTDKEPLITEIAMPLVHLIHEKPNRRKNG